MKMRLVLLSVCFLLCAASAAWLAGSMAAQDTLATERGAETAEEALGFLTATDPGTLWFWKTIERAEALREILPPGWAGIHASGVTLD